MHTSAPGSSTPTTFVRTSGLIQIYIGDCIGRLTAEKRVIAQTHDTVAVDRALTRRGSIANRRLRISARAADAKRWFRNSHIVGNGIYFVVARQNSAVSNSVI